MKPSLQKSLNFVLFYVAWFACVLLGPKEQWLMVFAVMAFAFAIHLSMSLDRVRESLFLVVSFCIGVAFDSSFVRLAATSFEPQNLCLFGVPVWMLMLWPAFATTLSLSMSWLQGRKVLCALFGAVGGPLSYAAGARLGALKISESFVSGYLILGLGWALALVFLMSLRDRIYHLRFGENR